MTARGVPDRFSVRRGGVELRGERWRGSPGAATAVLAPGGGQTRGAWRRTAARLHSDGHGVVTVDIRGHGESDLSPDGDYRVTTLAADLRAVCAAVEGPVVLVGASMSGLLGLLATEGDEPVADALVMVDIAIDSSPRGIDRVQGFLRAAGHGFDTLDGLARFVAGFTGRPRRPEHISRQARVVDGRWYLHWDPAFIENEPDFAAERERLVAAARTLTMPAVLVRGALSDVVTDTEVAAMRRLMPHLRVVDIGGAGHMITGDDNDVFATGLSDLLDNIAHH